MKKILMATLLIVTMIFTGCGGDLKESRKLVIGIDDEFAPLGFHNERNELVGFDIDLARETARRMGVGVEFKAIDWDKKKEEITSGSVDMIWNGLDITDERSEYMIFSKPYMDDRQILLVKEDSDLGIYSEYDLAGKAVGVQAGSTSNDYLNRNEELRSKLKDFKLYTKFGEAVDGLKKGEIDALVCDELVARYQMNCCTDCLKIINVKIGEILAMGIGFRKDNIELRDKVQKIFDEMIADGTAKEISEKWFQADLIKHK